MHGDLKPANVLLDAAKSNAKVCDFGHARLRGEEEDASMTQGGGGTPRYRDPAVSSGRSAFRKASDAYSFGVLAWQVLTGAVPFAGLSAEAVRLHVEGGGRPPLDALAAVAPPALVALLESCWAGEQPRRPSATEISSAFQAYRE